MSQVEAAQVLDALLLQAVGCRLSMEPTHRGPEPSPRS